MTASASNETKQRGIERAATLLLVRDGEPGLEVFMLERPARGAFPGLHVFPGGKVDLEDAGFVERLDWSGPDPEAAAHTLGMESADPGQTLGYWFAAVRECYEETGVLLASTATGLLGADSVPELHARRNDDFAAVCAAQNVRLQLNELRYFAHWITPEVAPRRFDTRFFVAELPAGQQAVHAPHETVSGEWVTPTEALTRADDGRWTLIMPTLTSLRSLIDYSDVSTLFAAIERFEHLPKYSEHFRAEGMQPGIDPATR